MSVQSSNVSVGKVETALAKVNWAIAELRKIRDIKPAIASIEIARIAKSLKVESVALDNLLQQVGIKTIDGGYTAKIK